MPAPTPTASVGQRVAEARAKAGLTQLQLAHAIGLTGDDAGASISRTESGFYQPRLDKLMLIARALGVPLESLLPE